LNSEHFILSYTGPALEQHEIGVKELAPALLSIGELLEESNAILNGERATIVVNIKATRPGSVIIDLSVGQHLLSQTLGLFSSQGVDAVVNAKALLEIIFGIGLAPTAGLVGLIKWVRNRRIKSVTNIKMGKYEITTEDGDVYIATAEEFKLFGLINIRKKFEAIITRPLLSEGIDGVSFGKQTKQQEVTKEEAEYFSAPEIEQEIIDESEVEMSLQVVSISFQDAGKSRFSDGNATFYAEIKDNEFNQRVKLNEVSFSHDDLLRVKLDRKQSIGPGGIKTDYQIIKVLEHRSAAVQLNFPFTQNNEDR